MKKVTAMLFTMAVGLNAVSMAAKAKATEEQETDEEPEILDPDHGKSEGDILDEMTGQMKLF